MFAGCGVQTGVCQAQALDWLAADDVRIDDLFDIRLRDMPIPNCVRVDDKVGAVFALIEAAGLVGANFSFQSALGKFLLE